MRNNFNRDKRARTEAKKKKREEKMQKRLAKKTHSPQDAVIESPVQEAPIDPA